MAAAAKKATQTSAKAERSDKVSSKISPPPAFSYKEDLESYRQMLLIRRFEERAGQLYGMGLIGGFCHLYIGQEAVVTGMQMALKPGDQVIRVIVIMDICWPAAWTQRV